VSDFVIGGRLADDDNDDDSGTDTDAFIESAGDTVTEAVPDGKRVGTEETTTVPASDAMIVPTPTLEEAVVAETAVGVDVA
jgi:hypothetical protein